jgi:hypothetical protein
MALEPIDTAAPAQRRPAVWPWLLVPLVALAIFFALRSFRATLPPLEPPPVAAEHDVARVPAP